MYESDTYTHILIYLHIFKYLYVCVCVNTYIHIHHRYWNGDRQFQKLEEVMSYMNQNQDLYGIEMQYATVSDYIAAVHKDVKERYVCMYIDCVYILCICVYTIYSCFSQEY